MEPLLRLWLKIFLGPGLTVTEINRKRVQKQENMNISNVKRCMDGTPKDVNKVRMI